MPTKYLVVWSITLASLLPIFRTPVAAQQRPLSTNDILTWKRIQTPIVSNDGQWFAYKLTPVDGDSELVVTHLADGKEKRFPVGEIPRPNPYLAGAAMPNPEALPQDMAFSFDSQWIAFEERPTQKAARMLHKQHKPLENNLHLLKLSSFKETDFSRVKRFAFSGESSLELAVLRLPPGTATATSNDTSETAKADEKPQGSDLILVDLAHGSDMNVGNVSDFAFDKKGKELAWLVDAPDKLGNGIYLRDLTRDSTTELDATSARYRDISWTDKGDGLVTLRGAEDPHWEDRLYEIVAFKEVGRTTPSQKLIFEPKQETSFPADSSVSAERKPTWMADLSTVTFGIHELRPKAPKDADKDDSAPKPDLVIWNWKDPRLQSMQQVQEARDKNFSYLAAWSPGSGKFMRLADAAVREVTIQPEQEFAVGKDVRAYELKGNLNGQQFQDVYSADPRTGARRQVLSKMRWVFAPSPDGTHLLYYENGAFLTVELATGKTHNLTAGIPASFFDTEDDHNVVKPPTRPIGWSKDSDFVLLTDDWDIWKVPANGGEAMNLTGNGKKDKIRYQSIWRLDPDDKGYDLAKPLYVRVFGQWTKKGGIGVIEPGQPGISMLHWDDANYASLLKAKNAETLLYSRETTQQFGDYYVTKLDATEGRKVTDGNPQQKNFAWTSGTKLVEYVGSRGDKMQGTLYLPANYQPGKAYPTIVYIYEKLTQLSNTYPTPGLNGFSPGAYTSNGYAVLTPDIEYRVNDPGKSSTACILAALNAAEATGVVDRDRVALHGHSWGGYQTAFAVTQTKAFRAAIAGAPLTDMVSMYSSIYWNTGSANQPIFESSQGRFSGGYWEQQDAYVRNSPVYHATAVQTPLLILHNDKDGAVDHTQGIEYFNTLRRLGKPVVMLEYKGENHGLVKTENMKDYTVRMKEFFDHFLMDKPAPAWWTDGVPRLKQSDELVARDGRETAKKVESTAGTK